jgi:protein-S-isoprenylcysteine O-methyltransferase Ste14
MHLKAKERISMKNKLFSFPTAGILLVLSWLLFFFLLHHPIIDFFFYLGWFVLVIGLVLIFLSIYTLWSIGRPDEGKDFTKTTTFINQGTYAIVRHPLYLGWALMYIAVMLFSQHWIILIMGIFGFVTMNMICRQEDQYLITKFGSDYQKYIDTVPSMNLLIGLMRLLKK